MHELNKLRIWKKAIDLSKVVYVITKKFPDDEKFGLRSQIRRAVVSIPSNIAEGAGRESSKEFKHFLSIANGSSCELFTQLIISLELKYINETDFKKLEIEINELQKMNYNLQLKLR